MALSVKDIEANERYSHLYTLSYHEVVPFVINYIKKCTLPVIAAVIILSIALIPAIVIRIRISVEFSWIAIFQHSLAGVLLLPILLILPHEILHIIPYSLSGARDIRIGAKWRDAYFYVTANKHPVSARWFMAIALTPAITITLLLLFIATTVPPLWQWSIFCSLFMHLTMCAGDLALINFYYINRKKKIITWDDTDKGEAYFYEDKG